MLKSRWIMWTAVMLAVSPLPATAGDVVQISFSATVEKIVYPQNLDHIAVVGDIITGTLTFDPAAKSTANVPNGNEFDLRTSEAGSLQVQVNGRMFAVPSDEHAGFGLTEMLAIQLSSTAVRNNSAVAYDNRLFAYCHTTHMVDNSTVQTADMRLNLVHADRQQVMATSTLPLSFDYLPDKSSKFTLTIKHINDDPTENFRINYGQIIATVTSMEFDDVERAWFRGQVFDDIHEDCKFDPQDRLSAYRHVKFSPGNYYVRCDAAGKFNTLLPTGEYLVQPIVNDEFEELCSSDQTVRAGTADSEVQSIELGVHSNDWRDDADVSMATGRARPGFTVRYTILVNNSGNIPFSGSLHFSHDAVLTEFVSRPAADIYSAPDAVWQLKNLPVHGRMRIEITLRVPPDETLLGRQLCAWARIDKYNNGGDDLLGNNVDEICQVIRGSYDPNDMQVFAETANADGPLLPEFKELDYLIRFQNEGTAEAVTVRVVDELSEFHYIGKLRIGACSHDFEFNFSENNALEWTFNNINLPPKSEDEAASQGFIKFHVQLNDDLPPGTEIPNQAAIYFDFNKAVLTNTVVSRIGQTTTDVEIDDYASSLRAFPNPAAEILNVDLGDKQENKQSATFSIQNLLGQELLRGELNSRHSTINLGTLTNGTYFLTVKDQNGARTLPLNIAR